jgi:hypothetical protein
MQMSKFQRFILSSYSMQISMVLQAHVAVSVYSKVVSGFSSDTIVINNAKRKWRKKIFHRYQENLMP